MKAAHSPKWVSTGRNPSCPIIGSNEALLKSIAQSTGGRFNPSPKQLFDTGGKYIDSTLRLWPGLLALAIVLNLIELCLRKWRGILESLRSLRPAHA